MPTAEGHMFTGIDVSGHELSVALRNSQGDQRPALAKFPNHPSGHKALIAYLLRREHANTSSLANTHNSGKVTPDTLQNVGATVKDFTVSHAKPITALLKQLDRFTKKGRPLDKIFCPVRSFCEASQGTLVRKRGFRHEYRGKKGFLFWSGGGAGLGWFSK